LITILVLVAAVAVSPVCCRFLGRNAGYPLAAIYLLAAVTFLPPTRAVVAGDEYTYSVSWVETLDVNFALQADGVGVIFTFIALLIGAVVFVYSARYLDAGRNLSFYLTMCAFTLSMVGLVLADDMVLLFIFWELTSLASFLLIARSGYGGELASLRTLLITFLGGLFFLAAVVSIIAKTGTTSVTEALENPVWTQDAGFTTAVAILVLLAAFTKSAQFPFHVWLPDAMAAATPVSAYLHAAAVVKAGIFLLFRFSPAFHATPMWNYTLIFVGLFTGALGAWFALQKTDLKKLMAYSTVSQLGLIVATIGVGTEEAIAAAMLHTIAHALFKSGLFMMVGVIDHSVHTRDIRRLPELRKTMPWSFAAVILGCASMAGIPPMLGFLSKEAIFTSMREAPGPEWVGWLALAGAVGGAVLTFSYCAKIVFAGFVDGTRTDITGHEGEPQLLIPAALPIVVGLPLAFVAGVLDTPVQRAVEASLPPAEVEHKVHLYLWHGFNLELMLSLLVFAIGTVIIFNRHKLRTWIEHESFNHDGAWVIGRLNKSLKAFGTKLALTVAANNPTRHVAAQLSVLCLVLIGGTIAVWQTSGFAEQQANLTQPIDAVVLVVVLGGVIGATLSDSRLSATVSLSAVGIAVTVQIFALGAPDVGLTQLLVEALTVLMILLVVQKLPLRFGRGPRYGNTAAAALALVSGVAAGVTVWALVGRRELPEVADYYLNEA
ncbi:MAG: proton-conducting transporter membrane subunit, partial [Ornithinimicrobium sp.]